jgi:hypothetical protein
MGGADASAARPKPSTRAAPRLTHPIQNGRRDHAAPDGWRRRVANVDHHQRVGLRRRHVSVRTAHGDANSLCLQHVSARVHERPRSWASMLKGMGAQRAAARRPRRKREKRRDARTWLKRDADATLPTIDPEPTMVVECASCRPPCGRARPSSVEGGRGGGDGGASGIGGYGCTACTPATGWWWLVTAPSKTMRPEGPGGESEHVPHATGQVVRAMK